MQRLFIATSSITAALRCRDALRAYGFNVKIEKRNFGQSGCGYGAAVMGDKIKIENILAQKGIKVLKIYEF